MAEPEHLSVVLISREHGAIIIEDDGASVVVTTAADRRVLTAAEALAEADTLLARYGADVYDYANALSRVVGVCFGVVARRARLN